MDGQERINQDNHGSPRAEVRLQPMVQVRPQGPGNFTCLPRLPGPPPQAMGRFDDRSALGQPGVNYPIQMPQQLPPRPRILPAGNQILTRPPPPRFPSPRPPQEFFNNQPLRPQQQPIVLNPQFVPRPPIQTLGNKHSDDNDLVKSRGIPEQQRKVQLPEKTPLEEEIKGDDNGEKRLLTPIPIQKATGEEKKKDAPVEQLLRRVQINTGIENGVTTNPVQTSNNVPSVQTTNGIKYEVDKRSDTAESPIKSPSKSARSLPKTPDTAPTSAATERKKIPMNKIQVGGAPSPNLKTVRSKIGSFDNASYKPGGGKVKIENRKVDFSKAQPKIAAKNDKYTPSGGDKKIQQVKLQWNAKPKIGSLDNATYKPGGGDKKIETVKLDFKDKAKPKVGSKDNTKHIPGGGDVKIHNQKIDVKAESKVGSLYNVKHKPGGGDKKIFNDREYLQHINSNVESLCGSGSQSPVPSGSINNGKNDPPTSDGNLKQGC